MEAQGMIPMFRRTAQRLGGLLVQAEHVLEAYRAHLVALAANERAQVRSLEVSALWQALNALEQIRPVAKEDEHEHRAKAWLQQNLSADVKDRILARAVADVTAALKGGE
jgi:hypothetical protein